MLAIVVVMSLLALVATTVGHAVITALRPGVLLRPAEHAVASAWLGTVLLPCLYWTVGLVAPMTTGVAVCVALLPLGTVALSRTLRCSALGFLRALGWRAAAGALGIACVVAGMVSADGRLIYDTGLYHVQAIQWLREGGSVVGLGLLHYRLAFVSSWFGLGAVLAPGGELALAVPVLGGYAFFLAGCSLAAALHQIHSAGGRISDWFMVCFQAVYLPMAWLFSWHTGASPDGVVAGAVGACAWSCLVQPGVAGNGKEDWGFPALAAVLAAAAMGLKASAAVALPVPLAWLWWSRRKGATPWLAVSLCAGAVFLTVAWNVRASGCALFPVAWTCLADLEWGIPAASVAQVARETREWAQWSGAAPPGALAGAWLSAWARNEQQMLWLLVAAACASAVVVARQAARSGALVVMAAGWLGTVVAVAGAPALRFALGYLLLPTALAGAVLAERHARWLSAYALLVAPVFVLRFGWSTTQAVSAVVLAAGAAGLSLPRLSASRRALGLLAVTSAVPLWVMAREPVLRSLQSVPLLWPAALPSVETQGVAAQGGRNFAYVVPAQGDQCWGAPIPCTPSLDPAGVALREAGAGWAGGFRRAAETPPLAPAVPNP